MPDAPDRKPAAAALWIVDDDDLTRELIGLIAADAGLTAESFVSGEEVLAHLASAFAGPATVLCDLQMPGLSGADLAARLRTLCGPETLLLAMSGSQPAAAVSGYDGFLLKPFSADDLRRACERAHPGPASVQQDAASGRLALDRTTYEKFAAAMPPAQVAGLYALCLDDAAQRLEKMRTALAARDDAAWRRLAHAIKGGCAMVGALELAHLASQMEENGLPPVNDDAPLLRFVDASQRLRRMLKAQ